MLIRPAAWPLTVTRTVRAVAVALSLGALAYSLGACSSSGGDPGSSAGTGGTSSTGGTGATGGTAGLPSITFELALEAVSPLDGHDIDPTELNTVDPVRIVVTTAPAAMHTVRLALIDSGSEPPLNAALEASEVITDPDTGAAQVTLTPPSTPATFRLRASSSGADPVFLDFAVPTTGTASLLVKPSYSGSRNIKSGYVASVVENADCGDLHGSPPSDGPIAAESAVFPLLLSVPADPAKKLAVIIRAGTMAWGCTPVNSASEGTHEVEVVLANVPIQLDASSVDFALGLSTASFDALEGALATPTQAIDERVLGDASDDVGALLDAMHEDASDGDGFDHTRIANAWDAHLSETLGDDAEQALRAPIARWIQGGIQKMRMSTGLVGTLRGVAGKGPTLTLTSVFGVPADDSGFTPGDHASWKAGADDGVLIGISMQLDTTTFLLGAARLAAVAEVEDADDLTSALTSTLDCDRVARTLVTHGEKTGKSTADCNLACTEALCVKAVRALVDRALASNEDPTTLDVALTGSGSVGNDAELLGFNATWLGRLDSPDGTTDLTGQALAPPAPFTP